MIRLLSVICFIASIAFNPVQAQEVSVSQGKGALYSNAQIQALKNMITALQAENRAMQAEIDDLKARDTLLQTSINNINNKITALEASDRNQDSSLSSHTSRITVLERNASAGATKAIKHYTKKGSRGNTVSSCPSGTAVVTGNTTCYAEDSGESGSSGYYAPKKNFKNGNGWLGYCSHESGTTMYVTATCQ